MNKDFILFTKKNHKLNITAYGMENINTAPCIFIVHGFKGFKDWGFFPHTAEYFAQNGYFVVSFDFSHNGIDKNGEFSNLDQFEANTLSLEIHELKELIDAYQFGFFDNIQNGKIGVLGHSRGGGISLLTSSKMKCVDAVAVWSSIAKVDRYTERQKTEWRKKGVLEIPNTRTGQIMRLGLELLDDVEENKEKFLNIKHSVKKLRRPLFIGHGEQDLTVSIKEAEALYKWADPELTTLYKAPSAGHTFDIVHPFAGSNEKFDALLQNTLLFFNTHLF